MEILKVKLHGDIPRFWTGGSLSPNPIDAVIGGLECPYNGCTIEAMDAAAREYAERGHTVELITC